MHPLPCQIPLPISAHGQVGCTHSALPRMKSSKIWTFSKRIKRMKIECFRVFRSLFKARNPIEKLKPTNQTCNNGYLSLNKSWITWVINWSKYGKLILSKFKTKWSISVSRWITLFYIMNQIKAENQVYFVHKFKKIGLCL